MPKSGPKMTFFTVRATLVGGETGAAGWRFRDQRVAEAKFKEVCGPLCKEAWLIRWSDDRFIRGKKQVFLERHWTFKIGLDTTERLLGKVHVLENGSSETDDPEARIFAVTEEQGINDLSLSLIQGKPSHNLHEIEIDFDSPADDTGIHVLVDPQKIKSDEGYCRFELRFAKASYRGKRLRVSNPDLLSPYHNLVLSCLWNTRERWEDGENTYGWSTDYRNIGSVDLKRAQTMADMLRKIQDIEETFPFRPKSFGEYVVVVAQRLGLNPDSLGCLVINDEEGERTEEWTRYALLESTELRIATDEAIARWTQSHPPSTKPRIFVVSDESAIVEAIPQMLVAKGFDARGSLSHRNGSWNYEAVLRDAAEFQPTVLFIFYNCHLCPKFDNLDLPSRLLRRFLFAKVLISRVGDAVSVRPDVLEYLEQSGREVHIVDVPFEIDKILPIFEADSEAE